MKSFKASLKEFPQLRLIKKIARQKKLKIYLVGGFLRDYLLCRPRVDFDFAVSGHAIKFARFFAKKIKGAFILLDKDHGCARVAKKKDGCIYTFDFSDFRKETLKGDLAHRDFTVNTLCIDIGEVSETKDFSEVLIDAKGALRDIRAKKIKMVSKIGFKEDPLRMIRAFSLRANLGFNIEGKTLSQIKKDKDRIRGVSYERIRDELFKILSCPNAAGNLKEMDSIGLLECVIPQLHVMYNVKQGGYHHLDVWPHSLETVNKLERIFEEVKDDKDIADYINEPFVVNRKRFALMKLSALLHDIGKPDTRKKEGNRLSFHGHEKVGKNIARDIAFLLKLSTKERHALEDMVFWHLRPGYLSDFKIPSKRAIFRYFRNAQDEAVSILILSWADQKATRGPLTTKKDQGHHTKIVRQLIRQYFDKRKEAPLIRLVSGHDLIKKLKLKPSSVFAKILSEIEEKQAVGKIKTKREALELAKKISQKLRTYEN